MFNEDPKKPVPRQSARPLPGLFDWDEPALMTQAPPRVEVGSAHALLADSTGGDGESGGSGGSGDD
jgi:hypothetical protein